nr:ribonuclease H-like domain-containing protein [Tanacetum cinerariifolium]
MDQDDAHMMAASKVPMLKLREFEIWRMKIEQYIQMMNYALWDVIENGPTLPKTQVVEGVEIVMPITSVKDNAQRRLEVKAISTLMMGISNEHQLKFNSIKDAKQLMEAIEKRFGELLGENVSQEDVNQKLLRSLSLEWNTYVVVWRNKCDLDTISMDDLYNKLKVFEPEVKGMSSSNSSIQNMAFMSSSNNNNTNGAVNTAEVVNTANGVSTNDTQVNNANIENLSDAVIYAFLASQPSSPQLRVNTVRNKYVNTARRKAVVNTARPKAVLNDVKGKSTQDLQEKGVIDNRCSRHMIGNMSYLTNYEEIDRGYVAFGGNPKGGKITGKGTIKTSELDFENVYFVKELKFNLFSVSQMCDKRNSVLLSDTECVVLSPDFKLTNANHVLLRVPRKNNMYSLDLKNIIPKGDHLGKFDEKADEGFFIGYSLDSKAFRVFNSRTRIVEETLHIRFSENTPNNVGSGPNWLFDIDALTKTMNYQPVVVGTQSNDNAGTKDDNNAEPKSSQDAGFKPSNDVEKKVDEVPRQENECKDQEQKDSVNSTNRVNDVSSTISAASNKVNAVGRKSSIKLLDDPNMPE